MKKQFLFTLCGLCLLGCSSNGGASNQGNNNTQGIIDYTGDKEATNDQFNFDGNYTPPELTIDGIDDDEQWKNASQEITFGALNQAKVKMYRGESALFCYFDVKDPDIETVGNNNGDDVTKGDSIEIYFDFKNDASAKPQNDDVQINIGAHGKTRIFVGTNGQWGSWNGLLDYSINLKGTLNNDTDEDEGYSVELMIPYAQVGITKTSTFGFALGHVGRGKESTHDTLAYTWGGLVYDGSFVDPQSPAAYIVNYNNKFYSRGNVPMNEINVAGTILDQKGKPLEGVEVKCGDLIATSNASGKYTLNGVDPNSSQTVSYKKAGYKDYEEVISTVDLRNEKTGTLTHNVYLFSSTEKANVIVTGVVKNPVEGSVANCELTIGSKKTVSAANGSFSIEIELDNDLEIVASKDNYKTAKTKIDLSQVVGKENFDIGAVSLYSPSSHFNFGGSRGITAVDAEVYRGFDGIHFTFMTKQAVANGDHVELFIDSKTSFYGRDDTDYRIDFKGDGTFSIVNFGNGSNTSTTGSKITNNSYLLGSTYYMEVNIPYTFLGVESNDIIGISAGMWSQSLSDWDGWSFPGPNFADYVAPEYSEQYARIGLDNGLYRAKNNDTLATKVYGSVKDGDGNPILDALVNGHKVDENGNYAIWYVNNQAVDISVTANGFNTYTTTILASELAGTPLNKDIVMNKGVATISGTCNVEGAKVYLEADPTNCTYVTGGKYSISVPSSANAYVIFEAEGYQTVRKAFAKTALGQSANNQTPITYNCVMSAN